MNEFDTVEKFEILDVPTPKPEVDEVLVKVFATSVNPLDYLLYDEDYGYIRKSVMMRM